MEGLYDTRGDTQGAIRHDPIKIETDHTAKATAVGTRAERIIEAEETGRRWADVDITVGAMPARGVWYALTGLRINKSDPFFAKAQGCFNGFSEPPSFGGIDL